MKATEFFEMLIEITDVIYKECREVPHDIGTKIGAIIDKHLDNKIFDAETFNTYSWNKDVMTDMAIEGCKEIDKGFLELINRLVKEDKNVQFRKESNMFVNPEEALITWNCLVDEQVSLNHLEGVLEATEKCLNDYPEAYKALDEFTWKELKELPPVDAKMMQMFINQPCTTKAEGLGLSELDNEDDEKSASVAIEQLAKIITLEKQQQNKQTSPS